MTLLVMSLIGNMIAEAFAGNPGTVNYSMFTSAFSMLSLFYLIPASFNIDWAIHPIIMIVIDVLNCIFFFCAAIALAAKLGCHSCSNKVRGILILLMFIISATLNLNELISDILQVLYPQQ